MSAPVWTMNCVELGLTQTLNQWGICSTQRKLVSMRPSELQLTFKRPFANASPLAFGYHCTVYRDGVSWFTGKVYDPDKTAAPESHVHVVTLRDPWASLEAIIYKQKAAYVTGPAGNIIAGTQETLTDVQVAANTAARQDLNNYPKATFKTPLIYTGTDDTTGAGITSGATVAQVLAYALTQVPGLFLVGSGFTGVLTPREKMTDVSCAEVIRRVCRWTPDVIISWDHSTSPPTINVLERATMAARTLAWPDNTVINTEIKPRWDIYRKGVRLYLDRGNSVGSLTYDQFSFDTAGDLTDPESLMEATLQLDPINTDPATGEFSSYDADPTGVAARLFVAVGTLFYDGSVGYAYQDLTNDNWLAKCVNITGVELVLATMRALVQSSVEVIESGRVTLTLGAPPQLSASDLQALNKIGRARVPGTQNDVNGSVNGGGGTLTIQPPQTDGSINGTLSPTNPIHVDETNSSPFSDFRLSTGSTPNNGNTAGWTGTLFPTVTGAARWLTPPVPTPIGSGTDVHCHLHMHDNKNTGQSVTLIEISSGSLDLRSYLPTNYSGAVIQITISGFGSFAQVVYANVTAALGKNQRFAITASMLAPYPVNDQGLAGYTRLTGAPDDWDYEANAVAGTLMLQRRTAL